MNLRKHYFPAGVYLFLLIILGGCGERRLARPTPQMDAPEQFWIRVLLYNDIKGCTLKISSPFSVLEGGKQGVRSGFEGASVPISIKLSGGRISIGVRPTESKQVVIVPESPHVFELNGRAYRGKLKLIVNADGTSFDAVNVVPLEPYLAGVVGAEMPDYWEPTALQAQAVAARTYCLYIKRRFGEKRAWDVRRTQANQVYRGVGAESGQVWEAVNKTSGQVLFCSHADGEEKIFPAYYSSACGGHTENSRQVFGDSLEPLKGVECPYCKDVARPRYFFWPMVQFDKTDVAGKLVRQYPKLKELGGISDIIVAKESNYEKFSRLTLIKLVGSSGRSDFLRAEDFRLTVDPSGRKVRSTSCRILSMGDKWAFLAGRGWGHSVGMCQSGAEAMARGGKAAREILSYYYPSSKIVSVY
ncbi:MAG: SpoIID/LytB domain-containing protein [Planctomycetota bacterium]|jgi:stage II sporulation protein D